MTPPLKRTHDLQAEAQPHFSPPHRQSHPSKFRHRLVCPRVYILFARGDNASDIVTEAHTRITTLLAYVEENFTPVCLADLLYKEGSPELMACMDRLQNQASLRAWLRRRDNNEVGEHLHIGLQNIHILLLLIKES